MPLSPKRFGFALASAATLFYLGCAVLMYATGPKALAVFLNSLFHGLDLTPILTTQMQWGTALLGLINIFVLTWLFGALMAVIYNVTTIISLVFHPEKLLTNIEPE